MFKNKEEMDIAMQQAKDTLNEQQVGNEDIYAEFKDDAKKAEYEEYGVVNSDNVMQNQENVSIETYPNEFYENPQIEQTPGEDYYNDYPDYMIDNNYTDRIFENGPTKAQIDSWKKQYQGYGILMTDVADRRFIFRTLNRYEYKQIVALQNMDALQREEIICETVTLWPEQFTWEQMANDKAGIPSTYAEIIMNKSGFTKEYNIEVL